MFKMHWDRFYKELSIGLKGLKRGILEIAITTSENIRIAKLLYGIYDIEKKIDNIYVQAGKFIYENHHISWNELAFHNEIKYYLHQLKTLKEKINSIEREIFLLREERWRTKIDDMIRHMRRGECTIEEFIIEQYSKADGKYVAELEIPEGFKIIALICNNNFVVSKNIQLKRGDRVFILGPIKGMDEIRTLFTASPAFTSSANIS